MSNGMAFTVLIDQVKAIEWNLNLPQAAVFAVVYNMTAWADTESINGEVWYWISRSKVCSELPILTDKTDTAWRHLKALEKLGLLKLNKLGAKDLIQLTAKGKKWNRGEVTQETEENTGGGNISEQGKKIPDAESNPDEDGNISESNSEKNPTYPITSKPYPITSNPVTGEELANANSSQPQKSVTQNEISPGWTFEKLIDPPPQEKINPFIVLPLESGVHVVTDEHVMNLSTLYPTLDVAAEFRMMLGWLIGNPTRRKQRKGINRFIDGWLKKALQQGGSPWSNSKKSLVDFEKFKNDDNPKAKRARVAAALRDIQDTNW